MRHILVLGGGFAGVNAALAITRNLHDPQYKVTLIDKNSFHLFTPSLYEVATSEEPKKNVCIPFHEIFGDKVEIVKGVVSSIDKKNREVKLNDHRILNYDYLIIALGSESKNLHIPGLAEHSVTLIDVEDALEIKNRVREKCHMKMKKGESVRIVIGGGGSTGTELTAELIKYRDHLVSVHNVPKERVQISLIQGSNRLLKELHPKVGEIAKERLEKGDVKVYLGSRIRKVEKDYVDVDGKKYQYDVFIWTGGVRPSSVLETSGLTLTDDKRLSVNSYLQSKDDLNVFAAGDCAGYEDPKSGKRLPAIAQVAHEEGTGAGENLVRLIKGKPLKTYRFWYLGYLIPLSGRYIVVQVGNFVFAGFFEFIFEQLVFLRYLLMILPPWKAFKRWNVFEQYLSKRI